jgi:hypothetical protein
MSALPPLISVDDQLFERRCKGRTLINRGASLFFIGSSCCCVCCVRDVTNNGAGIRLSGINLMPFDFEISFDKFRTMRRSRLIWRNGDFIGAAFES